MRSADPLGHTTTTVYDSDGNVQATVDPLLGRTTFAYDNFARRISLKDSDGNVTTFVYDALGRSARPYDDDRLRLGWECAGDGRPASGPDNLCLRQLRSAHIAQGLRRQRDDVRLRCARQIRSAIRRRPSTTRMGMCRRRSTRFWAGQPLPTTTSLGAYRSRTPTAT